MHVPRNLLHTKAEYRRLVLNYDRIMAGNAAAVRALIEFPSICF